MIWRILVFLVLSVEVMVGDEWRPYTPPGSMREALVVDGKIIVPYLYVMTARENTSYGRHPRVVFRVVFDAEGEGFDRLRAEKTAEVIMLTEALAIPDVTVFFKMRGEGVFVEQRDGSLYELYPAHGAVEFAEKGMRLQIFLPALKGDGG